VPLLPADLASEKGKMATRYLLVSTFNFAGHQALLFLANSVWGWPGGGANVFAACVMSIPAYLLSRAWVWEVNGRHDVRRQVLPFWAITVAGLLVSTVLAASADALFGAGLAVNVASLIGYFIVWVAKFFMLDRLFGGTTTTVEEVGV
jgi:putative flippase GtrA